MRAVRIASAGVVAAAAVVGASLYLTRGSPPPIRSGCALATRPAFQGVTLMPCRWRTRSLLARRTTEVPPHNVPPFAGAPNPSKAPIVLQQGRFRTSAPLFAVGRPVECETFGRLLTVHVPKKGETTAQFWTTNGTHVFLYLGHSGSRSRSQTFAMCGAATWFGAR